MLTCQFWKINLNKVKWPTDLKKIIKKIKSTEKDKTSFISKS